MDGAESSYEASYNDRKSALRERLEVRVRSERRRRWSSKDKLEICARHWRLVRWRRWWPTGTGSAPG
jgi:hypothetical protein